MKVLYFNYKAGHAFAKKKKIKYLYAHLSKFTSFSVLGIEGTETRDIVACVNDDAVSKTIFSSY